MITKNVQKLIIVYYIIFNKDIKQLNNYIYTKQFILSHFLYIISKT